MLSARYNYKYTVKLLLYCRRNGCIQATCIYVIFCHFYVLMTFRNDMLPL